MGISTSSLLTITGIKTESVILNNDILDKLYHYYNDNNDYLLYLEGLNITDDILFFIVNQWFIHNGIYKSLKVLL